MLLSAGSRTLIALCGSLVLFGSSIWSQKPASPRAPITQKTPLDGAKIYASRCASCHGAKGEGGAGYPKALAGDRSVTELTAFIHKSMPPGPVKCPVAEAPKVAAYVYDTFYSALAREKNRPARVVLSRLTIRQYQNSVADLITGFRPVVPNEPPSGLRGEYFKNRDFDQKARLIDRTDPQVKFDFGTEGPIANQFDPHHFSVAWSGSVLAPDTGDYEFVIRSDQAVRMWVNGWKDLLIDGWVRANSDKEFHGRIRLLGGRAYPIRLEFSKSTQGVDDSDKKKGKPAPRASVELLWTRPSHFTETIPSFCLYPQTVGTTYVPTTPFPPDDRSVGYERGTTVSKEWDEATASAALEAAHFVESHLRDVSGVGDDDPKRKEKLATFCRDFVGRAFRRPLTPDAEKTYVTKQFDVAPNPEMAVKRVVILALMSPRFLYREIAAKSDPYDTAAQLSFSLWDTLPDPDLLRAAKEGGLATTDQCRAFAERMANQPRAWSKLREFLFKWLKLDEVPDIVKNAQHYPEFNAATVSDLRTSFELYLQNTAWTEASDFRDLMQSNTEFLNGELAKVYGVNLPANAPFQPVAVDASTRCGVLTQPYLLSRFAYLDGSSPIHRGVLIVRNMLGRVLNPPPAAFAPLAASAHPEFNTRERVAFQTKPTMCASCHSIINPLGFTLEKFDAIGRLREQDNNKPVDTAGNYLARDGKMVTFAGPADLAHYLANGPESHNAFVEKLFQYFVKQPVLAYGPNTLSNLVKSFDENRCSIRKLLSQTVLSTLDSKKVAVNEPPKSLDTKGALH